MEASLLIGTKKDHASCKIACTFDSLDKAIERLQITPRRAARVALHFRCLSAEGLLDIERDDKRTATATALARDLELIRRVDCTETCSNCVWGELLDSPGFERAADVVGKMLELDDDKLDIASTIRIIDEER